MNIAKKILTLIIIFIFVALTFWHLQAYNIAILSPAGTIAEQQRSLIYFTILLSLIIVVPVFALTFLIARKYRASKPKGRYQPDFDGHRGLELLWWCIPGAIILLLAVITWRTSHDLDPYKPIQANQKPLKVQVVALQWKWLFIYPEQNIASVNYLQFPEDTPLNLDITADAPMNSFWVPQLGGQVYAMSGMSTKLHLMADRPGIYDGVSANLSGGGFSGMKFKAKSTSQAEFDQWVQTVKVSPNVLSFEEYNKLARPSKDVQPFTYWSTEDKLYNKIIDKYMRPQESVPKRHDQEAHKEENVPHHH